MEEEFLVPYATSSTTPKIFVGAGSDIAVVVHDNNTVVVHKTNNDNNNNDFFNFPPGFRFCPLDEELIRCYLKKKVLNQPLPPNKIHEVNLYKYSPRELSVMFAMVGEKEWYFFTPRDRKYKNGQRPNRAAGSGFWKATGADKPIRDKHKVLVGYRKALVFYEGKPPKGVKTNWIMHEYRVEGAPSRRDANDMRLDEWVLCRIYKKAGSKSSPENKSAPKTEVEVAAKAVVSLPQIDEVAQFSFLSGQDEMPWFYYCPMEYDVIANEPFLPADLGSLLITENHDDSIQKYLE